MKKNPIKELLGYGSVQVVSVPTTDIVDTDLNINIQITKICVCFDYIIHVVYCFMIQI